jgi:hypothetical protein
VIVTIPDWVTAMADVGEVEIDNLADGQSRMLAA